MVLHTTFDTPVSHGARGKTDAVAFIIVRLYVQRQDIDIFSFMMEAMIEVFTAKNLELG